MDFSTQPRRGRPRSTKLWTGNPVAHWIASVFGSTRSLVQTWEEAHLLGYVQARPLTYQAVHKWIRNREIPRDRVRTLQVLADLRTRKAAHAIGVDLEAAQAPLPAP